MHQKPLVRRIPPGPQPLGQAHSACSDPQLHWDRAPEERGGGRGKRKGTRQGGRARAQKNGEVKGLERNGRKSKWKGGKGKPAVLCPLNRNPGSWTVDPPLMMTMTINRVAASDRQSGIHCLIICAIQLLTPKNSGGNWRRISSPDIRNETLAN